MLGSPYLYDRKSIFYREHNKYHLFKDGIEYIVKAHHMKNEGSIVNTGHLKMIVNASSRLTLMSATTNEDQMQVESSLQPVMVKKSLDDSFSNDVPMQGIQRVDTFHFSSVYSVLLLLFLLVGTMWVMDATMNLGGCMVNCVNNTISFLIMFVMSQIFRLPTGCTSDTGQVRQTCPHFHSM